MECHTTQTTVRLCMIYPNRTVEEQLSATEVAVGNTIPISIRLTDLTKNHLVFQLRYTAHTCGILHTIQICDVEGDD
jgi:hypothetical protein